MPTTIQTTICDGTLAKPIGIPKVAKTFAFPGAGADWDKIPALPVPLSKKSAGAVKLAWRAEGLYGCATVKDADIKINRGYPWAGDCLEVFIEKDCARATGESGHAAQYVFMPTPDRGPGECIISVIWGGAQDNELMAQAFWRKTKQGYTIEFFFPAATLETGKMAAGIKLGFNYCINDAGKPVEFFTDKAANQGFRNPSTWGVIALLE